MTLLPELENALVNAVQRNVARPPKSTTRRWTRARIVGLAVGATVSLTAVAAAAALITDRPEAPEAQRQLPVLGTQSSAALADYRGKPTIVSFYASWCLPCREQARLVNRLARELQAAGKGAGVLIAYSDREADTRAFADREGLSLPVLADPDNAVATAYGIKAIPATFVLDAAGRIAATSLGIQDEATLRTAIAEATKPDAP